MVSCHNTCLLLYVTQHTVLEVKWAMTTRGIGEFFGSKRIYLHQLIYIESCTYIDQLIPDKYFHQIYLSLVLKVAATKKLILHI